MGLDARVALWLTGTWGQSSAAASQAADTWAFMLLRLFSKSSVLFCWSKAPDEDPANFLLPKILSQEEKLVVETADL